jgi:TRAP-type uncharacterized transport system substrate-binding protein
MTMIIDFIQRNWRAFSLLAALVLILGGAIFLIETLPPRTIVMATGPKGGANYELGARYREILAKSGVTLELRATSGGVENLQLLRDSKSGVSAAFVQGGVANKAEFPGIESLGALGYEPLWLFYRGEFGANLQALAGRRLSIGPVGSGSRALALDILAKTRIGDIIGETFDLAPELAMDKLVAGDIDAAFFVTSWDSPTVQTLFKAKGIELASFAHADAFVALYPFLNKLTVPAGVVDLLTNRPPADVVLLAPMASLAVRGDLNSALQYLLLTAAGTIHSGPGIFHKAGEFPAAESIDFPLSADAQHFYKSGRPFLQQYLPFWLATLVERAIVVFVPLIALMYPLFRVFPSLYNWLMQSKIERLYAELRAIEESMQSDVRENESKRSNAALDLLELRASRLTVPAAYDSALYTLRWHIALMRDRFKLGRPTGVGPSDEP